MSRLSTCFNQHNNFISFIIRCFLTNGNKKMWIHFWFFYSKLFTFVKEETLTFIF